MKSLQTKTTFEVIKESTLLKVMSTISNTNLRNITKHTR